MFAPTRAQPSILRHSERAKQSTLSLAAFLVPAFQSVSATRTFSTTQKCFSKIGREPLSVPPSVQFNVIAPKEGGVAVRRGRAQPSTVVEIKGPLGELSTTLPPYMTVDQSPDLNGPTVKVQDSNDRKQRAMWGTMRAYLQNYILGVSEGHSAILRLNGVGYRATVEPTATTVKPEFPGQKFINLKVGYSHPVELGIPKGVTASTPQPTRILLEGMEKEVVSQFAAEIRNWRKPEPYKGKGIFVNGETIKLKSKKIK